MEVIVDRDECNRPETTLASLTGLPPVLKGRMTMAQGRCVAAGNASQQSDGASVVVMMDGTAAAQRGITPLGWFCGFGTAGCERELSTPSRTTASAVSSHFAIGV